MNTGPAGVAIVGAGVISKQYLTNLRTCPDVNLIGVADIDVGRAASVAADYGVPHTGDVASILARDDVEIVLNLTTPAAHSDVAWAALEAGKSVFGEKPLVVDIEDGEKLLARAAELGTHIGCAPDTVLGAGIQSAVRALADGVIGRPIAAATALQSFGPESWHPSPEFLFQHGAGPLFDVGPYYLTALVVQFGSAQRVAASARQGRAERVIGSGPNAGTRFAVEVSTHVNALIDFSAGMTASSTFSFDSTVRRTLIEIVGSEGTLWVPNPNTFGGPLKVLHAGDHEWHELPVQGSTLGRGIGVVEMARAIRKGQPQRLSGDVALHVLELMTAIQHSTEVGRFITLRSTVERPTPLPPTWNPQEATLFR